MPDDKTTKAPETATPDTGSDKPPEQAPVKEPVKAEPLTPEQKPPEQAADKSTPPKGKVASTPEKAGAEKGPNVSIYNFSEIMAEKKAAEKGKTPDKSAPVLDKGKEPENPDKAVKKEPDKTAEPPKRRGPSSEGGTSESSGGQEKGHSGKRACGQEENFHLKGTGGQDRRGQRKSPESCRSEKGNGQGLCHCEASGPGTAEATGAAQRGAPPWGGTDRLYQTERTPRF